MKVKIIKPDGTNIELEGTEQEIKEVLPTLITPVLQISYPVISDYPIIDWYKPIGPYISPSIGPFISPTPYDDQFPIVIC